MATLRNLMNELWGYAETGFEEVKSAAAMSAYIKEQGFEVETGIANMPTAYVGTYGTGKPVICFLAEYDALSGMNQKADLPEFSPITSSEDNGHGCGHHILGVGAIQAACQYKDYLIKTGRPGTVKIVGCPAEETGSGKAYLARDGYFNDADVCLTWHPSVFNQVSTGSSQSCISVFFKFHGVSSHAAGSPHLGRSALDAAELMNVGVNYLREHMESSERVHYAYTNVGGKAPNVVQAEATLKYFVRSTTNPKCVDLYNRVVNCAKGAALMTGTTVEVLFDEGLSNTVPNFVLEDVLAKSFEKCYNVQYTEADLKYAQMFKDTYDMSLMLNDVPQFAVDKKSVVENIKTSPLNNYFIKTSHSDVCEMGSTDVGDVSWCVPTAQVNTACYSFGAGGHSWQWVAQGKSDIAYKGAMLAADVLADAAMYLNEHPQEIEKAKEELNERLSGDTYKCLIPADVMPHISNF